MVMKYVLVRIEALKQELEQLHRVLSGEEGEGKTRLRGLWKGLDLSEEDFREAGEALRGRLDHGGPDASGFGCG